MTPRTPPGQTRERIYLYVRDCLLAGNPPTIREVQQAFDFKAVESARAHLSALVNEGRLLGVWVGNGGSPKAEQIDGARRSFPGLWRIVPPIESVVFGAFTQRGHTSRPRLQALVRGRTDAGGPANAILQSVTGHSLILRHFGARVTRTGGSAQGADTPSRYTCQWLATRKRSTQSHVPNDRADLSKLQAA